MGISTLNSILKYHPQAPNRFSVIPGPISSAGEICPILACLQGARPQNAALETGVKKMRTRFARLNAPERTERGLCDAGARVAAYTAQCTEYTTCELPQYYGSIEHGRGDHCISTGIL